MSNANASGGTSVYPGDSLDTAPSGELRLTIAGGQVYLLSDTAVRVDSSASVLRATLLRGTIGFTSLTDRQFQIVAPEGLIEAADHLPAWGQVTITGPSDLVISAYNGALFLHRGDQSLVVKAGQSYYVSPVRDRAPSWRKSDSASPYHLVSRSVLIGTATGVGYWLWRIWTESPVDPRCRHGALHGVHPRLSYSEGVTANVTICYSTTVGRPRGEPSFKNWS